MDFVIYFGRRSRLGLYRCRGRRRCGQACARETVARSRRGPGHRAVRDIHQSQTVAIGKGDPVVARSELLHALVWQRIAVRVVLVTLRAKAIGRALTVPFSKECLILDRLHAGGNIARQKFGRSICRIEDRRFPVVHRQIGGFADCQEGAGRTRKVLSCLSPSGRTRHKGGQFSTTFAIRPDNILRRLASYAFWLCDIHQNNSTCYNKLI